MKSTPRFRPRNATAPIASTVKSAVSPNAQWRRRTKPMLVLSGTSFSRSMLQGPRHPSAGWGLWKGGRAAAGDASLRWHDGLRHMWISVGRFRRIQPATSMRVNSTAVNTLVAMPISSTTAKPFTGPEPSSSMMSPDIA